MALLSDEFTWKLWIFLLRSKNKFFDTFKLWLLREEANRSKLDYLQMDSRGEFISIAFQSFFQKRRTKIRYAVPYMHEDNGIMEQCYRTLELIKDSLLIDSGLPTQF